MLFLLSPAKTLDYESPPRPVPHTRPLFVEQSTVLIDKLRTRTPRQLSRLMSISDNLAQLNAQRYRDWAPRFTAKNSRASILAFNGDVYDGFAASTLDDDDLAWAQDHVCILSGLYGVLRPLDRMQPYRLEMGTALPVGRARNLYQFWGKTVAAYLNERAAADASPVIVNLASQEYVKVVDRSLLRSRMVECVFEEWKAGRYGIISFFAKRARGLMARHAVRTRAATPAALEAFREDGYAFDAGASAPDRLVFRRRQARAT